MKPYLVHLTDLFHPHGDPDDHYDLATVFSLHKLGFIELGRVICDYPPAHRLGDPAFCAVAQLNEITGSDVRFSVAPSDPNAQAKMILDILRAAEQPVCFSVVGTTEHIAGAIRLEPELFSEKCAGIYLAAGTGIETPGGSLEYNVRLHPSAFITTLNAPCPVYWAPCYHTIVPGTGATEKGGEYGSVYCIQQKELLDDLPAALQKYFLYMLTRSNDPKYLRYLEAPVDAQMLSVFGEQPRRLWSTPLFLRLAGIEGDTYEYLPVEFQCSEDGHVSWSPAAEKQTQHCRYIFHIRHCDRQSDDSFDMTGAYKEEMLKSLKQLLARIE